VPTTTQQLEFRGDDRQAVVASMVELAALPGTGWINFDAGVDEDVPVPSPSIFSALFGARGPVVPHCSWVPEPAGPTSIGIQHASGPRAMPRLVDAGLALPAGWRLVQDHPRRGLVVAAPAGAAPEAMDEVLGWLLRAGRALAAVPLNGYWMATVHRRR
jgi:hypothetical protein